MLSKLLKNDFIATGRIMGIVYAIMAIVAGYFTLSYYMNRSEVTDLQALSIVLLVFIALLNFVFTAIIMIKHFQDTLYNDQGYLSFTLPVKGSALLTSKVITSVVWFVAAFLCVIGSAALVFFTIKDDVIGEETYQSIESLLPMILEGKSISTIITSGIIQVVGYFIKVTMITVELYFAISLANTRRFQKMHTLFTIIFIFLIVGITGKIGDLIADYVYLGLTVDAGRISLITSGFQLTSGSTYIDLCSILTSLVFGAVFYYLTFYIMNKKVNIR